jgi:hypothetical protein
LIAASILVFINVNIVLPPTSLTPMQRLKRIDWLGSLTLVSFVAPLLAGFSLKATDDLMWKDPRVWGPLLASAVAFPAFIFVEAKVSPEPVMPMGLLLSRTPLAVSLTNLSVFALNIGKMFIFFLDSFGSIVSFSVLYNVPLVSLVDTKHFSCLTIVQYFMAVRLQSASEAGLHLVPNSVSTSRCG